MKETQPYNQFDELVKEKFSSDLQQPEDLLWKRLNDQLQTNDEDFKRRKFFLWGMSSFLVLFISILAILFFKSESASKVTHSDNKNLATTQDNQISGKPSAKLRPISTLLEKRKNGVTFEFIKDNLIKSSSNDSVQVSQTLVKPIVEFKRQKVGKEINRNPKIETSPSNFIIELNESRDGLSEVLSLEEIENKLSTETFVNELSKSNVIDEKVTESNFTQVVNDIIIVDYIVVEPIVAEKKIPEGNDTSINYSNERDSESIFTQAGNDSIAVEPNDYESIVVKKKILLEKDTSALEISPLLKVEPNAKSYGNKGWFLGFHLTPAYSYRNLKEQQAINTPLNKSYFDSHEKGKLQLNYGISAGYTLNNSFALRTGFNLMNYSVTLNDKNLSMRFDTVSKNIQVPTNNGDFDINESDFEDDESNDIEEEELNEDGSDTLVLSFTNTMHMKFIQIPIELEVGIQNNKFRYFLRAGGSYGYLLSQRSDITIAGFLPVRLNQVEMLKRSGINVSVAVGAEYLINKHWSVLLSPNFNYSLTTINQNSNYKSHPFWLGMEFSAKYFLK